MAETEAAAGCHEMGDEDMAGRGWLTRRRTLPERALVVGVVFVVLAVVELVVAMTVGGRAFDAALSTASPMLVGGCAVALLAGGLVLRTRRSIQRS